MFEEAWEKLLVQAETKKRRAIAAAEAEYQQVVEAVRLVRGLSESGRSRVAHGRLSSLVLAAVEQIEGGFTVRDVEARLHVLSPEIAERTSIASISTTLRRLVGRKIQVAEPGNSTTPSRYRRVDFSLEGVG